MVFLACCFILKIKKINKKRKGDEAHSMNATLQKINIVSGQ